MENDTSWLKAAVRVVIPGIIGLLVLQLVLGWLVVDVFESSVASFDDSLSRWLVENRTSVGDAVGSTASELGHTVTIVVGAIGFGIASLAAGRWRPAFVISVALVMELIVFVIVNAVVARPRPDLPPLGSVPSTHSFPSGHSAASVVLYFGLTIVAATALSPGRLRRVVWVVGAVVALSVGVARAYAAVHHPTDVFAGWLVGAGCLAITIVAVGGLEARRAPRPRALARPDAAPHSSLSPGSGASLPAPSMASSSPDGLAAGPF